MNYQEALEDIKNEHFLEYSNFKGFARRIDTLQELIDNYNKMQNEFDMLLDTTNQFEKENTKLEKALDKACRLTIQNNNCESYISIYKGTRDQYNLPLTQDTLMNEKILKEYLLMESEQK